MSAAWYALGHALPTACMRTYQRNYKQVMGEQHVLRLKTFPQAPEHERKVQSENWASQITERQVMRPGGMHSGKEFRVEVKTRIHSEMEFHF
jgi:hypothetical protein